MTRHGRKNNGLVNLAAEIFETAVLDGRHRTERLLVEVIPIHLVFEQLPAQLGGAAVGLLIAHPNTVAGMVQAHLRGRASDGHQIAAAIGIPGHHRGLRRRRDRRRRRRRRIAATAQNRDPDLQRGDAPHQLEIQLVLAVDAHAAAFFGPHFGLAEEMRRRGRQLRKIVVDVPGRRPAGARRPAQAGSGYRFPEPRTLRLSRK